MLKNVYLPIFARKQKNFSGQLFFEKNIFFQKFCKNFAIFFSKIPAPVNAPKKAWRRKTRKLSRPQIFRTRLGDFSARLKISQKSQKIRKKF